jgi:DNA (cytosine-5)-methyltransferase 1
MSTKVAHLRALDLCAGAGGLSLGLRWAGWEVLGVERDAHAVEAHRRNVGPCIEADVETFHPTSPAELVCGGVPCQPFSQAGDRRGTQDSDGRLWEHLLRIATEAGARAVLLENVRGFATWRTESGSRFVEIVAKEFRRAGFTTQWRLLDAADYGVPQHRDRVFLVGFREATEAAAWRWPAPTHAPPGTLLGLPPYRTVRDALGLGAGALEAGRKPGAKGWQGMRRLDVDRPAPTVATTANAELLEPLDRPAPTVTATEGNASGEPTKPAPRRRRCTERLAGALREAGLHSRPSTTVTTDPRIAPAGHHASARAGAVRLTATQLAALQAFPEGFEFVGTAEQRYRQIGNAVPPPMGKALGEALKGALERGMEGRR